MHLRSIVLLLTVLVIAALAALNWPALAAPSLVSLGVVSFEAPLGLLMLALTALLGIFFVAYVLSLQGSVLLETRRHTKEMQVQRELADKAEASPASRSCVLSWRPSTVRPMRPFWRGWTIWKPAWLPGPMSQTTQRQPMWASWSNSCVPAIHW